MGGASHRPPPCTNPRPKSAPRTTDYPEEIEETAGGVPGIRKGCVAAFSVSDPALGTERLIVVAESRATDAEARQRLRMALIDRVVAGLGIPPDTVVIAPPRCPSSGSLCSWRPLDPQPTAS